jgi:cytoskeletal protein CcmA (bactofilin family)
MAIFNSPSNDARRELRTEPALGGTGKPENAPARPEVGSQSVPSAAPVKAEVNESVVAADLSIEGKIQGSGHVRIAGRFSGDVHLEGDVVIERGAKVTGGVRAGHVTVAGELVGDIESARRVELLETSVLVGNVKAEVVIVAAGAKLRGQCAIGNLVAEPKAATKPAPSGPSAVAS